MLTQMLVSLRMGSASPAFQLKESRSARAGMTGRLKQRRGREAKVVYPLAKCTPRSARKREGL